MRKIAIATFASLVLAGFNTSCLLAQQEAHYPWSASPPVVSTPLDVSKQVPPGNQDQGSATRNNAALDLIPVGKNFDENVPMAPSMKLSPLFSMLRNKTQDEPQPSLSDAAVNDFKDVPAPGAVEPYESEVYPRLINPQDPSLSVESKLAPKCDCNRNGCEKCNLGCIKRLFGKRPSGLEIGGWVQVGYYNHDTILFNDRSGRIASNQIWFYAENEADRCCNWDIGYRVDTLYGLDAQNTQAFGNEVTGAPEDWDNSWDNGAFGWALPQTYVQFANSQWDVKLGKFFAPYGNERIAAPENFFYSRTYTSVLSQPYTMTGLLGERRISPTQSILLGGSFGWDTGFEQNGDGANFITGLRLRPNRHVKLGITSSYGDPGYRRSGSLNSMTANVQLTRNVRYAFQGNVLDLGDNQEFGFVNSLFRDVNCCLSLGARFEWWKSDQFTFDTQSTYAFTMGANYRPNANIIFRPEIRWDWGAQALNVGQSIAAIDAIIRF